MKTLQKQILVAVFISIALMTSTANAGFLDWFASSKVQAQANREGSFDQLYASISSGTVATEGKLIMSASLNAIEGTSTPSGGFSKTLRKTYWVQVSGYNSEVAQTDDSPFIGAMGTHVRDGMVAANMLPFGTAIKFKNCGSVPEDKIFVVEDRMNKRYQNNVDIWFESKTVALKLGRRTCQIEVI